MDRHQVFFFVVIGGTHHFIHKTADIRHQNQPLRILIQSSDWVDSGGIAYIVYNISFLSPICGADHAGGLINSQKHFLFPAHGDYFFPHLNLLIRPHTHARLSFLPINCDTALLNHSVRLTPGTYACFA